MKELEYYLAMALTPTAVPLFMGTITTNIFAYMQVKSDLEDKGKHQGLDAALQSAEEIKKQFKGKRIQSLLHFGEIWAAKSYSSYNYSLYGRKFRKKK